MNRSEIEFALLKFLDPALFGKGQSKTWDALLNEIVDGECQIDFSTTPPFRRVNLVTIEVFAPNGMRLLESHQKFSDGRIRERGLWGVSEKLKPGEDLSAGVIRAMFEDLGLRFGCYYFEVSSRPMIERKDSPSYPGLQTYYCKHQVVAVLSEEFVKEQYIETQGDKTTLFIWRTL